MKKNLPWLTYFKIVAHCVFLGHFIKHNPFTSEEYFATATVHLQ